MFLAVSYNYLNTGVFMTFIMDETGLKVFNDFLLQSKNLEYIKQFEKWLDKCAHCIINSPQINWNNPDIHVVKNQYLDLLTQYENEINIVGLIFLLLEQHYYSPYYLYDHFYDKYVKTKTSQSLAVADNLLLYLKNHNISKNVLDNESFQLLETKADETFKNVIDKLKQNPVKLKSNETYSLMNNHYQKLNQYWIENVHTIKETLFNIKETTPFTNNLKELDDKQKELFMNNIIKALKILFPIEYLS